MLVLDDKRKHNTSMTSLTGLQLSVFRVRGTVLGFVCPSLVVPSWQPFLFPMSVCPGTLGQETFYSVMSTHASSNYSDYLPLPRPKKTRTTSEIRLDLGDTQFPLWPKGPSVRVSIYPKTPWPLAPRWRKKRVERKSTFEKWTFRKINLEGPSLWFTTLLLTHFWLGLTD